MGLKCGRMCGNGKGVQEFRVGLLGLDNAGKTTILYQLKTGRNVEPTPTFGLNVESIILENMVVSLWEVGGSGQAKARILWQHYNQQTRAIIFVVDSTDIKRLAEAVEAFHWLCWQPELSDAVFLVYANKQDLPGALSAAQIAELFELPTLLPPHKWAIYPSCAITGLGLLEGIETMLRLLNSDMRNDRAYNIHNVLKTMKK